MLNYIKKVFLLFLLIMFSAGDWIKELFMPREDKKSQSAFSPGMVVKIGVGILLGALMYGVSCLSYLFWKMIFLIGG